MTALRPATAPPTAAFTAAIKQEGPWWIGWIEEVPAVNCQEPTRKALIESLREALAEALACNREQARLAAGSDYTAVEISPVAP